MPRPFPRVDRVQAARLARRHRPSGADVRRRPGGNELVGGQVQPVRRRGLRWDGPSRPIPPTGGSESHPRRSAASPRPDEFLFGPDRRSGELATRTALREHHGPGVLACHQQWCLRQLPVREHQLGVRPMGRSGPALGINTMNELKLSADHVILAPPLIGAYALFGLGIVVIYRASRVLNLAHGAMVMLPGYIAYSAAPRVGPALGLL